MIPDDQYAKWYNEMKPIQSTEEDVMFSKFLEKQKSAIYESLGIPKEMIVGIPKEMIGAAIVQKLRLYRPIGLAALTAFQIFMRQTSPMYCLLMGDK